MVRLLVSSRVYIPVTNLRLHDERVAWKKLVPLKGCLPLLMLMLSFQATCIVLVLKFNINLLKHVIIPNERNHPKHHFSTTMFGFGAMMFFMGMAETTQMTQKYRPSLCLSQLRLHVANGGWWVGPVVHGRCGHWHHCMKSKGCGDMPQGPQSWNHIYIYIHTLLMIQNSNQSHQIYKT